MYYNITGITARLDSGQGRHPRLERRGQPSPHHPFTPVALTEARGKQCIPQRSPTSTPPVQRSTGDTTRSGQSQLTDPTPTLRRVRVNHCHYCQWHGVALAVPLCQCRSGPARPTASGHSPAGHWQDGSACHQSRSAYLTTLPRVTGALAHPPFSSVTSAPQRQARLS
jgi:hypothetical protein